MRSILTDLTLIACLINYAIEACLSRETEYEFLTEDLSFKTIYRVQAYLNSRPAYINYIYERYSQPSSASIWQSRHHWDGEKFVETDLRQFLYSRREDKIVEIDRCASKGLRLNNDFSLFENGGSISYGSSAYSQGPTGSDEAIDSIKLVPNNSPFDSVMISNEIEGQIPKVPLNLDNFLSDDCLVKINLKLRHIKGISRLLHLIECRRQEFRFYRTLTSRDRKSREYVAQEIHAVRSDKPNDQITKMSVTYTEEALMKSKDFQNDESKLPSRVVPDTMTFFYDSEYKGESKNWLFIINLYQFETLSSTNSQNQDLNDHPISSHSVHMLPSAHGVVELLPARKRIPEKAFGGRSFSFSAKVTGTRLPFKQPLDLMVLYDAERKVLASQFSQVILGSSPVGAYTRLHARTVHDRRSGLIFHLMDHNYQYNVPNGGPKADSWASCATHELADQEVSLDKGLYDGLDAAGTGTYLGRAIVRGIESDAYEKRLYRIPQWLGIQSSWSRDAHTESGDLVFANLYVTASDTGQVNDLTDRRLLRLELNILSRGRNKIWQDKLEGMKLVDKIQIEFYGFQWKSDGLENAFGVNLLELCRQECMAKQRRVKMNILYEPINYIDRSEPEYDNWLRLLQRDTEIRNGLISEALYNSYRIAPIQQTDLTTEWMDSENLRLRVELDVNELPRSTFSVQKVMDARDLTPRSVSRGSDTVKSPWINGATSVSMQECVWRAAHTLMAHDDVVSVDDDYSRQDDDPSLSKKIMYCPRTLHCVLGNTDWSNISLATRESMVLKDTLMTIVDYSNEPKEDRCSIFIVSRRTVSNRRYGDTHGTLVEWLRSGQDLLLDKLIELKQVNVARSLKLRTAKLRVSKIYSDYGSYESNYLPLHGFGYDPRAVDPSSAGDEREVDSNYLYKPMVTKQLANCEHTCLMHHNCRSFSACHYASVDFDTDNENGFDSDSDSDSDSDESAGKSRLVCVFASLNWTDPVKLKQLSRLTTTDGTNEVERVGEISRHILELNVRRSNDDYEEEEEEEEERSTDRSVKVRLRRSPLCSLHARSHWDLYRSASQNITDIRSSDTMLLASNYDQCARFCLTRAHLLTLLLKRSGKQLPETTGHQFLEHTRYSDREYGCRSFRYNSLTGYCALLPELNYTNYIDSLVGYKQLSRLELEWLEATKGMRKLAKVPNFAYFSTYVIDYDHLYVATERTRIEAHSNELVLQRSLDHQVTSNVCADECVRSRYCRSFDMRFTRTSAHLEAAAKGKCVLNAVAAFDLRAAGGSAIDKLARLLAEEDDGASSVDDGYKENAYYWRHHEPTELLLYAISDPVERPAIVADKYSNGIANDRVTGETSSNKHTSVYINLSSARDHWRLVSSRAMNTDTTDNSRDNSAPSSSNWTPLALTGVVAMAIVVLVLAVIGFYSTAANTGRVESTAIRACYSGTCNLLLAPKLTLERLCQRIMNAVK